MYMYTIIITARTHFPEYIFPNIHFSSLNGSPKMFRPLFRFSNIMMLHHDKSMVGSQEGVKPCTPNHYFLLICQTLRNQTGQKLQESKFPFYIFHISIFHFFVK